MRAAWTSGSDAAARSIEGKGCTYDFIAAYLMIHGARRIGIASATLSVLTYLGRSFDLSSSSGVEGRKRGSQDAHTLPYERVIDALMCTFWLDPA